MSAMSAAFDPSAGLQAHAHPESPAPAHSAIWPDEAEAALLRAQIRRRPDDETAHRLLGLAHLAHGRIGPAVGHLEIALRLVWGHARRAVGLTDVLQRQCEAAGLRLILMRLHARLGNAERVASLALETQRQL